MTQPSALFEPKSIQGEQQERQDTIFADQADVEKWVDSHDPNVVDCRERNRHTYPSIREAGRHFDGVDVETGFHIRRLRCKSCKLVGVIELWDVRHRGDTVTRMEKVSSKPDYSYRGPNGEKYLSKTGRGRMKPKQVRDVVATNLFRGMSYTELRKESMRRNREHES